MTTNPIFAGDSTSSFGSSLLQISLKNALPSGTTITKAVIAIGPIRKEFDNPTFPIVVNLTEEETAKLQCTNQVFMAVYDGDGKKKTCTGSLKFNVHPKVV